MENSVGKTGVSRRKSMREGLEAGKREEARLECGNDTLSSLVRGGGAETRETSRGQLMKALHLESLGFILRTIVFTAEYEAEE